MIPMSSLTHETKTREGWRLRVYTAAGRRSIWLGRITEPEAIAIQRHADEIIAAQTADLPIPRSTALWLDRLAPEIRSKLRAITGAAKTVSAAIDEYLHTKRAEIAESTWDSISLSLDFLRDNVGNRRLDAVPPEIVDSIYDTIDASSSTRGKIAKNWRAFFRWAIDRKWITDNPARHLSTAIAIREKQFVASEIILKAIAACDNPQLAVVIALARFGGIRMSSELRGITWSHIDRHRNRIRIIDTKRSTEREIPLFPEISATLDRHDDGDLCRDLINLSHAAITSRFVDLLHRLEITPWPVIWHSMRATRETELIEAYGLATAAHWIGNSPSVAMRSYAIVSDAAWRQAIG